MMGDDHQSPWGQAQGPAASLSSPSTRPTHTRDCDAFGFWPSSPGGWGGMRGERGPGWGGGRGVRSASHGSREAGLETRHRCLVQWGLLHTGACRGPGCRAGRSQQDAGCVATGDALLRPACVCSHAPWPSRSRGRGTEGSWSPGKSGRGMVGPLSVSRLIPLALCPWGGRSGQTGLGAGLGVPVQGLRAVTAHPEGTSVLPPPTAAARAAEPNSL